MCRRCYDHWWRTENLEKARKRDREYNKQWRADHPGRHYKNHKRWRSRNPHKRNEGKKRNYIIGAEHNYNSGEAYSTLEEIMILFKIIIDSKKVIIATGAKDRELAKYLGRTVQTVQARRCLIKKSPTHVSNLTSVKGKLESSN
jgi:hypothetical protein